MCRLPVLLGAFALCLLGTRTASACSGTPVAPGAITLSCAHPDADAVAPDRLPPPNLRVGLVMGWTAIDHEFSKGGVIRRRTLSASIGWRPIDSITLFGDLGAIIDGDATIDDERHIVDPGMRGGLGIAWRAFDGDGGWPFILFSAKMSVLSATTAFDDERHRLTSFDLRSAIAVGRLFGSVDGPARIGPYMVARSITGALYWDIDGRIRSTQPGKPFQIGLGLTTHGGVVDAFAEVIPFGERAAVVGIGASF